MNVIHVRTKKYRSFNRLMVDLGRQAPEAKTLCGAPVTSFDWIKEWARKVLDNPAKYRHSDDTPFVMTYGDGKFAVCAHCLARLKKEKP